MTDETKDLLAAMERGEKVGHLIVDRIEAIETRLDIIEKRMENDSLAKMGDDL